MITINHPMIAIKIQFITINRSMITIKASKPLRVSNAFRGELKPFRSPLKAL
jgi:hypothetical protein